MGNQALITMMKVSLIALLPDTRIAASNRNPPPLCRRPRVDPACLQKNNKSKFRRALRGA